MSEMKALFDKQYSEGKLTYRVSFPRLRKRLRNHLNDRYDVTKKILEGICGERMLDFGCGSGSLIFRLQGQFKECFGLDILASRIEEANNFVNINHKERKKDFHFGVNDPDMPIPFPDEFFDVVTSIAVLPWTVDPYFIGRELHRVTKSEGHVVLECPNMAYFKRRLKLLFGKLPTSTPTHSSLWPEIGWDGGCMHYFTKKNLVCFLEQCGFTIEKVKPTGFLSNFLRILPTFFATGWVVMGRKKGR